MKATSHNSLVIHLLHAFSRFAERFGGRHANPGRPPASRLAADTTSLNFEIVPANSCPVHRLIYQDGRDRRTEHLRISITKYVKAPAGLLYDLWSAIVPFPEYRCLSNGQCALEGSHDQWAIHLASAGSLPDLPEAPGDHVPAALQSSGQIVFRAARPNLCRLTLSLDFTMPTGSELERVISDHVARLEQRLDHFVEFFDRGLNNIEGDQDLLYN